MTLKQQQRIDRVVSGKWYQRLAFWQWPELILEQHLALQKETRKQMEIKSAMVKLGEWIHATHRLDAPPRSGIRSILSGVVRVVPFLLLPMMLSAQPAPFRRNAWTTNVAGDPVKGFNDLSVTNLGSGTNWQFFNVGPFTIARLSDVTNIASSFTGGDSGGTNSRQGGSLVLTNLSGNPIPYTNVILASTAIALGTNGGITYITNTLNTNAFQPSSQNLTNWSNIPTGAMANVASTTFLTNWANAVSNYVTASTNSASVTNWITSRQPASENLTNWSLIPTGAMANVVSTTFLTNWANSISNLAQTKQHGTASLTNLSGNPNVVTQILAGANITVTSNNAGVFTIAGSGGGTPGGAQNSIQVNQPNGIFYGTNTATQVFAFDSTNGNMTIGNGLRTLDVFPDRWVMRELQDFTFGIFSQTNWRISSATPAGSLIPNSSNTVVIGNSTNPIATIAIVSNILLRDLAGNGKVLTSDADGVGTWQTAISGGDAGGTNARQFGSATLTNLTDNPYKGYTNEVFGGTNVSVRTVGGTNFIDTVGQLNNWSQFTTNVWNSRQGGTASLTNLSGNPNVVTNILGAGTVTVTSNNAGTFTITGTGGGGVAFSDLVWTNTSGTLYPRDFPTNIVFNPTNAGAGGMSTMTNFLFQTSTRRIGGTNMLFGVFNGGASALTVGDQGIMIGSTNHILVPQMAIDIAYDMAFGVDTPDKSIFMSSYDSTIGYSGNTELAVSTNYGRLQLLANKEGNGFIQIDEKVGGDAAFINYDKSLLVINAGNTFIIPYQLDPDFSVGPTSYIFGSTIRITNTHTLMSLQNSNTPMFEVNGIGDLKLLKRVPYSWPSSQGAAQTVLTNDGSGNLGWGAATAGGSGFAALEIQTNDVRVGLQTNINFLTNANISVFATNNVALNKVDVQFDVQGNLSDWALYPTNVWNSRQGGSESLTNLSGNPSVATNILGAGTVVVSSNNLGTWTITGGTNFDTLLITNQVQFIREDKLNAIAFRTNQIDFTTGSFVQFTNGILTNLVFQLTNLIVGAMTTVDVYGGGRFGHGITNAWNVLCTASAGTTIVWPPGTTNGNFDVLINSNQVCAFYFRASRSTNIVASYKVFE